MTNRELKIQQALGTIPVYLIKFSGAAAGVIGIMQVTTHLGPECAVQYAYKNLTPLYKRKRLHSQQTIFVTIKHCGKSMHAYLDFMLKKDGSLMPRLPDIKTWRHKYFRALGF